MRLIPQENPENIREKTARRARHFMAAGPGVKLQKKISPKIVIKLQAEEKKDRNILRTVCIKLINFIKGRRKYSDIEMSELIHGMQRSVLSLERVRRRKSSGRGKRNGSK